MFQVRQMVNQFNQKSVTEGKTEVVEAGDPDGSLFLINPEVYRIMAPYCST